MHNGRADASRFKDRQTEKRPRKPRHLPLAPSFSGINNGQAAAATLLAMPPSTQEVHGLVHIYYLLQSSGNDIICVLLFDILGFPYCSIIEDISQDGSHLPKQRIHLCLAPNCDPYATLTSNFLASKPHNYSLRLRQSFVNSQSSLIARLAPSTPWSVQDLCQQEIRFRSTQKVSHSGYSR